MIPQAVVHIGFHKTGTTSIQQTLFRGRTTLHERFGLVYPSINSNHSIPLFSMFTGDPASYIWNRIQDCTTPERIAERNAKFRASLDADLSRDGKLLVLSGEDLCLLPKDGIARFREWLCQSVAEIRILAYVREPVAWAVSQAQQLVKGGHTLEMVQRMTIVPRYRDRLSPWMEVFGKSNMEVCDFDVALGHEHGLIGHFLERVGLAAEVATTIRQVRSNESFSAEAISLLSKLNESHPRFVDGRVSPDRSQADILLFAKIQGARFALHPEIVERTKSGSEPEVSWLNDEFGLTFRPPRAAAPPSEGSELFSSETYQASLARLIRDLGERSRTVKP